MKVTLLPAARADQREAWKWYRSESLQAADWFREDLKATIGRIGRAPEQFPLVTDIQRRALLSRFPYSVLFELLPGEVLVVAIAHTSRHPEYWRDREPPTRLKLI